MDFDKENIEALLRLAAEALFENGRISSLPLSQIATQIREKYPAIDESQEQEAVFGRYRTQRMIERQSINFVRASNWLSVYYRTVPELNQTPRADLAAKEPSAPETMGQRNPFRPK